jgi:hypothetical protein
MGAGSLGFLISSYCTTPSIAAKIASDYLKDGLKQLLIGAFWLTLSLAITAVTYYVIPYVFDNQITHTNGLSGWINWVLEQNQSGFFSFILTTATVITPLIFGVIIIGSAVVNWWNGGNTHRIALVIGIALVTLGLVADDGTASTALFRITLTVAKHSLMITSAICVIIAIGRILCIESGLQNSIACAWIELLKRILLLAAGSVFAIIATRIPSYGCGNVETTQMDFDGFARFVSGAAIIATIAVGVVTVRSIIKHRDSNKPIWRLSFLVVGILLILLGIVGTSIISYT